MEGGLSARSIADPPLKSWWLRGVRCWPVRIGDPASAKRAWEKGHFGPEDRYLAVIAEIPVQKRGSCSGLRFRIVLGDIRALERFRRATFRLELGASWAWIGLFNRPFAFGLRPFFDTACLSW